jgi:transposase-like protein
MKRKRFTEEQIIAVLREHDAGAKAADLARKHGISEATLYNWKAKYGGMDVSDAKRLRSLEVGVNARPTGAGTEVEHQKSVADPAGVRSNTLVPRGNPFESI